MLLFQGLNEMDLARPVGAVCFEAVDHTHAENQDAAECRNGGVCQDAAPEDTSSYIHEGTLSVMFMLKADMST